METLDLKKLIDEIKATYTYAETAINAKYNGGVADIAFQDEENTAYEADIAREAIGKAYLESGEEGYKAAVIAFHIATVKATYAAYNAAVALLHSKLT